MDVVCPQCGATYELNESQIPGDSARVKCSSCEHIFRVHKNPEGMGPPTYTATTSNEAIAAEPLPVAADNPPPEPGSGEQHIVVRSANGVISHIPDQATLQRMVVERKLVPTDELSYDGNIWHGLGSLLELQPFFQLLVQASPSQAHVTGSGSVMISGQIDPASTLEFGLPSSYDPSTFPPSRPGMMRADGSISQETARYQESNSDQYSSGSFPMHIGSQESLPYGARVPTFPSQDSSGVLPAGTTPYGQSSGEYMASPSAEPMDGVSFTTLEPREGAQPSGNLPVQVKLGQDQTRIPTMITRSDDGWPIGPAAHGSQEDLAVPGPSNHSGLHSSPSIEPYFMSQDEIPTRGSSRAGRWFALLILILGLGVGSYALFNPNVVSNIATYIGITDTNMSALQHIREAREVVQQVTPMSFQKAQKELDKAQQEAGKPFTALLATKATVELLQVDILDLRLSLLSKKQTYWKKKLAELKLQQSKPLSKDDDSNDDDDDSPNKSNPVAKQVVALAALLKKWDTQGQEWRKEFNQRWQTAKTLVGEANKREAQHPYTMIARLHLRSLSRAANSSQKNSDFQKHYAKVLDRLEDRGLQGWIYLHGASVAIRHKQYNRGLGLIRNAVKYCNHPNWLYPRLLGAWVWVEKGNHKKAEMILKTIDKSVSEHPRVSDFREVLSPPSLDTLLASYQQGGTNNQERPTPPTPTQESTTADAGSSSGIPTPPRPSTADAGTTTPPDAADTVSPERDTPVPKRTVPVTPKPKLSWRKLQSLAYRDCYRGRVRRGMRRAKQALRMSRNGYTYSTIGWCHLQRKRYSRAIRSFAKATRYRGRRSDTYYGLGLSYLSAGNRSKACNYFRQHLRSYPRHRENGEVRVMVKKHKCQ